ncbi:MAG TPA: hypothetical protein VLM79_23120, partial [Kofleriaceae bacterium]|nr:hypothetical protein [Kofleriaceae bacterium]
ALADRAELATVPNERRLELMANEIAETYTYAPDGTISVRIENLSRGYGRTYTLGAEPGRPMASSMPRSIATPA